MKRLIVSFFILISWTTYAQRFQNFTLDKTLDYKIKDEGKSFEIAGQTNTTKSDAQVDYPNKYNLLTMPLVRSLKTMDTLQITLESINEAIYIICTIKIVDKAFSSSFKFTQSGDTGEIREMKIDNSKLVLSDDIFKKGRTVRGRIEFNEQCLTGDCPDFIKNSTVKGNFVVTVE